MKVIVLNNSDPELSDDFEEKYPEYSDYNFDLGPRNNSDLISKIENFGIDKAFDYGKIRIIEIPDNATDFITVGSQDECCWGYETLYYVVDGKIEMTF